MTVKIPDSIAVVTEKDGIKKTSFFNLSHAKSLSVSHEPEFRPLYSHSVKSPTGHVITRQKIIIEIDYGDGIFS